MFFSRIVFVIGLSARIGTEVDIELDLDRAVMLIFNDKLLTIKVNDRRVLMDVGDLPDWPVILRVLGPLDRLSWHDP